MSQLLPVVVLLVLAVVFGIVSFAMSRLLAPRRPSAAKEAPYECGIVPSREPPERFPVSFYLVAMLFIMFDIEIIFIYPYAVSHSTLGTYGFWAVLAFSVVFFATFVYEVARGGTPIELTATEFELLRFLMLNPRRVLSKAQILDRVWSYDFGGKESVVELYISYLRKKVDAGREPMIHTVRGAGYMLKAVG